MMRRRFCRSMRFDATGSRVSKSRAGRELTRHVSSARSADRRRQLRNSAFERLEIEAGASDHQRNDSTLIQRGDRLAGQKAVFVGVAQISQRENSDQMVGDRCELGGRWLTGQNVETVGRAGKRLRRRFRFASLCATRIARSVLPTAVGPASTRYLSLCM